MFGIKITLPVYYNARDYKDNIVAIYIQTQQWICMQRPCNLISVRRTTPIIKYVCISL